MHRGSSPVRPGPRWPALTRAWWALVVVLAVLTLWALTPWDTFTPAAQLVALRALVVVACVGLGLLALVARERLVAAASAVLVVVSVGVWVPAYVGSREAGDGAVTLRVLTVNALQGQADAAHVVGLVRDEKVDALVVVELTDALVQGLRAEGLDDVLPHSFLEPREDGPGGSGLWTRASQTGGGAVGGTTFAMPYATVDVAGCDVRLTAVHPYPPIDVPVWSRELALVATHLRSGTTPQVAAGDFNASWEHARFRSLLGGRFEDAARAAGAGWQPTWPTTPGPFTDIDHVLVDEGMGASAVRTVDVPGSDHRAVLAMVHVPPSC